MWLLSNSNIFYAKGYQFYWPMCSSRKHPYPPDGGHFFFRPPTPLRFPFQGVLVVPPTSWNFRDFPSFGNLLEKASKTSRKIKYLIGTKFRGSLISQFFLQENYCEKREIKDPWNLVPLRCKIPQVSPGAYIFQRPFWRGLSTEGNLRLKIDWASKPTTKVMP